MKEWVIFLDKEYPDYKIFFTSSGDKNLLSKKNIKKIFKKNNKINGKYYDGIDTFFESDGNSILVCVNRCREGSDIPNVDCAIYLDGVMKRSTLVSLQTSGRIVRPDEEGKKKYAVVVDMFIAKEGKTPEMMTVSKILNYYMKIISLSHDNQGRIERYKRLNELLSNTKIDKEKNKVTVMIDNKKKHNSTLRIKLINKNINWDSVKEEVKKEIIKRTDIEDKERLNIIIEKLKNMKIFDKWCNFDEVYENIEDKERKGLPENIKKEFKSIFDNKTRYELFGYNTSRWFQTPKEAEKFIRKSYNGYITKKVYYKIHNDDETKENKLPPYPNEFYRTKGFVGIEEDLNTLVKKNNLTYN